MPRRPASAVLAPTDRALQFHDIPAAGRSQLQEHMREKGANVPQALDEGIARLEATPDKSTKSNAKLGAMKEVRSDVVSKPITLEGASKNRQRLYKGAVAASPAGSAPDGAGWYFKHHADIAGMAKATGHDTSRAITASALMSPQNSPDNEKQAIGAIMDAHAGGHTVRMTPQVAASVSKASGIAVPDHQINTHVPVHELAPEHLAHLSGTTIRDKVEHTGIDFKGIGMGNVKSNIAQAIHVVRGGGGPTADLIDPSNSPKVHSYRGNIEKSVPNSPTHVEYMSRVIHHADVTRGEIHPGQETLDLYGLKGSHEGVLNPKGPTTEDTWQHAITTGQKLDRGGSRSSPAKTVVEQTSVSTTGRRGERIHPDSRVGTTALTHAYNNEATTRATAALSRQAGTGQSLPNIATQEVGWTASRREAGKDPEQAKAQRASAKVGKDAAKTEATLNRNQFSLF